MADTVGKTTSCAMMGSVRSNYTKIETELRRRLYARGFLYRLYLKGLPGASDSVFPKYQAAVSTHDCFWHVNGCRRAKLPETRHDWWKEKFSANHDGDLPAILQLQVLGWRVMVAWRCRLRTPKAMREEAVADIVNVVDMFLNSELGCREIPDKPFTGP